MDELGSGIPALLLLYTTFSHCMWPLRDAPPMDVSGHPNSCDEQSWWFILVSRVLCALCEQSKSTIEHRECLQSSKRAHLRIGGYSPPDLPSTRTLKIFAAKEDLKPVEALHCATEVVHWRCGAGVATTSLVSCVYYCTRILCNWKVRWG